MESPNQAKTYSKLALSYDHLRGWFSESSWCAMLAYVPDLAGKWVLDAGCGTGIITDRLANEVGNWGQVIGIDACQEMLDRAQCRLSDRRNITLNRAMLNMVPARDRSFDLIVCTDVLHELSDIGPALKEWRRVLNTMGEVVILDWDGSYWPISLLHRYWRIKDSAYKRAWKSSEVESALKNFGFSITDSKKARLSRYWRVWIIRARKD